VDVPAESGDAAVGVPELRGDLGGAVAVLGHQAREPDGATGEGVAFGSPAVSAAGRKMRLRQSMAAASGVCGGCSYCAFARRFDSRESVSGRCYKRERRS
jgi:hypothetical protein